MAPILETRRLRLRAFEARDLDPHAASLADPRVYRHLGGTPFSREDAWRKLLAGPGMWALLGYGYWAVERKADGAFIGQIGFADFKRDMIPAIEGLPEMGWVFVGDAHGQGYASEAASEALAWMDESFSGPEIVAIIDFGNSASIRIAEKSGFSIREDASYKGEPILLFRRQVET